MDLKRGQKTHWDIQGKQIYLNVDPALFWYFWGNRSFDIRAVREVCGKQRTYKIDYDRGSMCTRFEKHMLQLEKLVAGRKFSEILDAADKLAIAAHANMKKVTGYIVFEQTRETFEFEVDDDTPDDKIEEMAREEAFNFIEWGYKVRKVRRKKTS